METQQKTNSRKYSSQDNVQDMLQIPICCVIFTLSGTRQYALKRGNQMFSVRVMIAATMFDKLLHVGKKRGDFLDYV
jgi:hypothetical protein